jgi:hypothetical protein
MVPEFVVLVLGVSELTLAEGRVGTKAIPRKAKVIV